MAEDDREKALSEHRVCLLSGREASLAGKADGRVIENAFYAAAFRLLSSSMHVAGANQDLLPGPDSILCALAMAGAGARGETRARLSGFYNVNLP